MLPVLAMIAHWGLAYVAYGLTHLPLALTSVLISVSALAAPLLLNHLRKRKLRTITIGATLLGAFVIGGLGEAYLFLALAGCC